MSQCQLSLCEIVCVFFFCFKQKTAYEMRISDWSSDVCSSDLSRTAGIIESLKQDGAEAETLARAGLPLDAYFSAAKLAWIVAHNDEAQRLLARGKLRLGTTDAFFLDRLTGRCVTDITTASRTSRSEGHTSELQSLMRTSYAVFCLQKKKQQNHYQ